MRADLERLAAIQSLRYSSPAAWVNLRHSINWKYHQYTINLHGWKNRRNSMTRQKKNSNYYIVLTTLFIVFITSLPLLLFKRNTRNGAYIFWKYPNLFRILSQMELGDILWTIFTWYQSIILYEFLFTIEHNFRNCKLMIFSLFLK